jgi:hypothetical protein
MGGISIHSWSVAEKSQRRNANATDSNRASPRCRGVGFGGRRRGKQEDEKIWCCSEQRVVEQFGWWTGGRPGICDYYPALPDLGMDWGVKTRGGLIQGCKACCSRTNPPGAGCRHRRSRHSREEALLRYPSSSLQRLSLSMMPRMTFNSNFLAVSECLGQNGSLRTGNLNCGGKRIVSCRADISFAHGPCLAIHPPGSTRTTQLLNTEKGSFTEEPRKSNPQSTNPPMRAPEGEDPLGNPSYELRAEDLKSTKSKGLLCPSLWLGPVGSWPSFSFPVHWRATGSSRLCTLAARRGRPGSLKLAAAASVCRPESNGTSASGSAPRRQLHVPIGVAFPCESAFAERPESEESAK